MRHDPNFVEKVALLALAATAIISLTLIGVLALRGGALDAQAATLLGMIATGLIAFGKDIISAVRAYAMSAQLGKVTDQLAASGPVTDPTVAQPVTVVNPASDPVQTEQV